MLLILSTYILGTKIMVNLIFNLQGNTWNDGMKNTMNWHLAIILIGLKVQGNN